MGRVGAGQHCRGQQEKKESVRKMKKDPRQRRKVQKYIYSGIAKVKGG